jgi:hypothetical protein
MKVFLNSLVVVGAIVAIGSPAQAAQITFSLVGSSASATTFNYSDPSGLMMEVTAPGSLVNQDSLGLGVGTSGKLDLSNDEKLQFRFSQTVGLIRAVFTNVDDTDRYALMIGKSLTSTSLVNAGSSGFSTIGEHTALFDKIKAVTFQFSAFDTSDDYRLKSITVDDGKPTAVPTPAMLPGLVGLGLGLLRRRIAA